jgi:diguanylate cyclase (GGDEF)-like protein/PAS domain S-box-containing protein
LTPGNARLSLLLVEDDADDALLTRAMLREARDARFEIDWARTPEEATTYLEAGIHDVYLVDYRLGARTGLDVARAILCNEPYHPVIMLTGQADRDVDLRAAELGIADYLVKGQIDGAGLERSIRYAISHQRALRALADSEERYALAVAGANDGLWDWDLRTDLMYLSTRWKSMLGFSPAEIAEDPAEWFDRVHPADRPVVQQGIRAHLHGSAEHFESEHRIRARDGRYRWVLARGLAVYDVEGRPTRFAGSLTDITERKRAESQLQHDALHDALTDLPNRVLFLDRLQHALSRRRGEDRARLAVLFLDLDRFKLVNDSLGHLVGDRLLVDVARRLESALRPGDTVARLGGDEFTVLVEELTDPEEAEQVADRVLHSLAEPFRIDDRELYLSASIGIAVPGKDVTAGEVIRDADAAMYRAKAEGKGRHAMFDTALHEQAVARLDVETRLRRGLAGGGTERLHVVYQPIVDLRTGRTWGFEALARWREADGQLLAPDLFIPIAEETGLVRVLGREVLHTACAQLVQWRAALPGEPIRMSVNISRVQLLETHFVDEVRAALTEHGLDPDALRLEVTETDAAADAESARLTLQDVHGTAGVQTHLDDFGTGASSLTFLRGFPGDALKIDRSFIFAMSSDEGAFQIVKAILGLAHNLGMSVVAEGVEHEEHRDALIELGCEFGQGYLFDRPLEADAAFARLQAERVRA